MTDTNNSEPLPADTQPDEEREEWRLTPGERRFETPDPMSPVPPMPADRAAAYVVMSGRFNLPLTQAQWHDVSADDLDPDIEVRHRTVRPGTEEQQLDAEQAKELGLPEGATIPVEQPAEVYDSATFRPGDGIPAELVRPNLWDENFGRLIPVTEDGEPIEVAEPEPEEPPEPTDAERALAAYQGVEP